MKLYTFEPNIIDNPNFNNYQTNEEPYLVEVRLAHTVVYTHSISYYDSNAYWQQDAMDEAMDAFAEKLKVILDTANGV